MSENTEITTSNYKSNSNKPSPDDLKNISLLPRSAWNSQLTHLKVLLKAKQALDENNKQLNNSHKYLSTQN